MIRKIPALRFGEEYQSYKRHPVVDLGDGTELASLTQVDESLIATDCLRGGKLDKAFKTLQAIPMEDRVEMSVQAAEFFMNDSEEYIDLLSRTSGLSHKLALQNRDRIVDALRNTRTIINGLTLGMPYEAFDHGIDMHHGTNVRLVPQIKALGACMPNNAPGVHVLWPISLAFGIPVLVRPGSAEPFTPYRLVRAHIAAGYPQEVLGYYPCGHAAMNRIPELTGGALVFGSDATVGKWKHNPLVHTHGSGDSKVIIGEDRIEDWRSLIPELALNMSANSGRSCFKASRIMVPRYGKEIAAAIAEHVSTMIPRPLNHDDAMLSAMSMPDVAKRIDASITAGLQVPGAQNMSAMYQPNGRLVVFEGRTYLLPSIMFCDSYEHTLANKEFMFPFCAVVEQSNDEAFATMSETLSLAVYTHDEELVDRALQSKGRLVTVNKPTCTLDRTQPHERQIFNLFYQRLSYVA